MLQRFVMQRATPTGWQWSSSWKPGTLYATQIAATQADALLEQRNHGIVTWDAVTRAPTLYTYTNTNTNNQITGTPQGPHTAPHVHITTALGRLTGRESLMAAFYEQIPWPEQVVQMLCIEKNRTPDTLDDEYKRFSFDYNSLYGSTERALWNAAVPITFLQVAIGSLMDMNPYATYAWKSGVAASKKSTKGKGERATKPFRQAIDKRGRWVDKAAYEKFIDTREQLVEGEYEYGDEEPTEEDWDEGLHTLDSLLAAVEPGQVGETVMIWPTGDWIIESLQSSGGTVTAVRLRWPA